MTSLALAWRTAQRYRARTVLAIVGVAIIGALLFDMLLLSRGLLLSFADLLGSGGYDLRVVSSEGMSARVPIANSARLADDIGQLPDVQRVTMIRIEEAAVRVPGGPARGIGTAFIGTTGRGDGAWTILKGADLTD